MTLCCPSKNRRPACFSLQPHQIAGNPLCEKSKAFRFTQNAAATSLAVPTTCRNHQGAQAALHITCNVEFFTSPAVHFNPPSTHWAWSSPPLCSKGAPKPVITVLQHLCCNTVAQDLTLTRDDPYMLAEWVDGWNQTITILHWLFTR